ncbi:hypothetical protein [Haliscomenobacter sp.]|uniref:hypothetical protein n=1 Tax=Haliscomenobacter sp. TaxID=2717303 RepID=UPI003BAB41B2
MKNTFCTLLLCTFVLACQPTAPKLDFEKEKAAIQAVIAKETESYYKQDFEAWKSTYLESPAFRKYGYWEGFPEKVTFNNGFESLKNEKKSQFEADATIWKGSSEERANENFRISPEMAWYTFEQFSYEKGTRKLLGKSLETRVLEKVDGEWKIAYLGYHYFPDTLATK